MVNSAAIFICHLPMLSTIYYIIVGALIAKSSIRNVWPNNDELLSAVTIKYLRERLLRGNIMRVYVCMCVQRKIVYKAKKKKHVKKEINLRHKHKT